MLTRLPRPLVVAMATGLAGAAVAGCGGNTGSTGNAGNSGTPSSNAVKQITGGQTKLRINQQALTALSKAGIDIAPIGAATRTGNAITFPIAGGSVNTKTFAGRIRHDGGLRFTFAGQSVDAKNLIVRPKRQQVTAQIAGRRVPLLSAPFSTPGDAPIGADDNAFTLAAPATTLSPKVLPGIGDTPVAKLVPKLSLGRIAVVARD